MIPLTLIFRKVTPGYDLAKKYTVNHLLFMDDLKLFGKTGRELCFALERTYFPQEEESLVPVMQHGSRTKPLLLNICMHLHTNTYILLYLTHLLNVCRYLLLKFSPTCCLRRI